MFKPKCLFIAAIFFAACSSKTSNDATTNDSTQVVEVTKDSTTTILPENQAEEGLIVEDTDVDGETSEIEKMYAIKSEEIKANVHNFYEATLTVNGYESSTSVLFYFNQSASLLYVSEDWNTEGQTGTDEYFADDDNLIFSHSETSYDDEGGTVTQTILWNEKSGGTIFTTSQDGNVTTQAANSNYGTSIKNEFSSKANAVYEILKNGEVTDNGSTIEVKIVEAVNYVENFEKVTTLAMPKTLYSLLIKQ